MGLFKNKTKKNKNASIVETPKKYIFDKELPTVVNESAKESVKEKDEKTNEHVKLNKSNKKSRKNRNDKNNKNDMAVLSEEKTNEVKSKNDIPIIKEFKNCDINVGQTFGIHPTIKQLYIDANYGKTGRSNKLGKTAQIDLCAYLKNKNGLLTSIVYYNSPKHMGIGLASDDNTTNNHSLYIDFERFPKNIEEVYLSLITYNEEGKPQNFSKLDYFNFGLKNSFDSNNLCSYNITLEKNPNSAILFGRLVKQNEIWYFQPLNEFSNDSIHSLKEKLS